MKPRCIAVILLGLVPFIAVCFSVSLWDRIYPVVFGLPFNFFWLILWILVTPLCMWASYVLQGFGETESTREQDGHR